MGCPPFLTAKDIAYFSPPGRCWHWPLKGAANGPLMGSQTGRAHPPVHENRVALHLVDEVPAENQQQHGHDPDRQDEDGGVAACALSLPLLLLQALFGHPFGHGLFGAVKGVTPCNPVPRG